MRKRVKGSQKPRTMPVLNGIVLKTPPTPIHNGLSYPRPGSHWNNRLKPAEVVVLQGKYDSWVYFYVVGENIPLKMPADVFYHYHSLLRQALPDENFMEPIQVKTEVNNGN